QALPQQTASALAAAAQKSGFDLLICGDGSSDLYAQQVGLLVGVTGVARRNADGSWVVENLRLNDIRLQSDKSLSEFFAPLTTVPS
ncbi:hypothetical protein MJM04_32555, partial [Salmonella enterica subsp. enterica serovar Cerro]|nr:hypothetical protein [Salmonella enterica subsp. enterica serovar Cerro]